MAISAAIKYIAILILPFLILYYLKDKNLSKKVLYSIIYTIVFLVLVLLMYIPCFNTFKECFSGIFAQQGKAKDSIYLMILVVSNYNNQITSYIYSGVFFVFLYYFVIKILFQTFRENSFKIAMKNIYFVLMFLIFLLLTNVTSWYLIWLFIPFYWIKAKDMRNVMWIGFFYELTYTLFLAVHSDKYIYNMWVLPMIIVMMIIRWWVIKVNDRKVKLVHS